MHRCAGVQVHGTYKASQAQVDARYLTYKKPTNIQHSVHYCLATNKKRSLNSNSNSFAFTSPASEWILAPRSILVLSQHMTPSCTPHTLHEQVCRSSHTKAHSTAPTHRTRTNETELSTASPSHCLACCSIRSYNVNLYSSWVTSRRSSVSAGGVRWR